jgi:hypothetical protein
MGKDSKLSDAEIKKTADSLLTVSQHIANGIRNGAGKGK